MHELDIDGLLTALRRAGLRIGVVEVLRLQRVLGCLPVGSDARPARDRLRAILRAIVAKSQGERETCDAVFDAWFSHAEYAAAAQEAHFIALARAAEARAATESMPHTADTEPGKESEATETTESTVKPGSIWRLALVASMLVGLVVALVVWIVSSGDDFVRTPGEPTVANRVGEPDAAGRISDEPRTIAITRPDPILDAGVAKEPVASSMDATGRGAEIPDISGPPLDTGDGIPVADPEAIVTAAAPMELRLATSFRGYVPVLTAEYVVFPWPWLLLALGAATVAFMAWRHRRNPPQPEHPRAMPLRPGPVRVFLEPMTSTEPQLIAREKQDMLVWGIEKYIAEEHTQRIDLQATVRATARAAGIPHIAYHHARYLRDVWVWSDESARNPSVQRIGNELVDLLAAHGLPVERSLFHGIPESLANARGGLVAPEELEDRRDSALVCIFTDGIMLVRQHQHDNVRRREIDALLRNFAHWPRLAFVDMTTLQGDDEHVGHYLHALLGRHELQVIRPDELAVFLGGGSQPENESEIPDVAGWAGACALMPAPIDEDAVLAVRQALELDTSPFALALLRAEAPGPGGRLHWKGRTRARRINWLSAAQSRPPARAGNAGTPLLERALDFWLSRYDRVLDEAPLQPWYDTLAHQRLEMERALLQLWRTPDVAIDTLFRLHQGPLRTTIEQHLEQLAPAPDGDEFLMAEDSRIRLPWTWDSRPAEQRLRLAEMKLSGERPRESLRAGGRLWLGIGLCLSVMLAALGSFAWHATAALQAPSIDIRGYAPDDAYAGLKSRGFWNWRAQAVDSRSVERMIVGRGTHVTATWVEATVPCRSEHNDASIIRCGAYEPRAHGGGRGVLVMDTSTMDPQQIKTAEKLAHAALDCEQADVVYLGSDWHAGGMDSLGYASEYEAQATTVTAENLDEYQNDLAGITGCKWILSIHGIQTVDEAGELDAAVAVSAVDSSSPETRLRQDVLARVNFVQDAGDGRTLIRIIHSYYRGIQFGWRGQLVAHDGTLAPGGNVFSGWRCQSYECMATIPITKDLVMAYPYIVLEAESKKEFEAMRREAMRREAMHQIYYEDRPRTSPASAVMKTKVIVIRALTTGGTIITLARGSAQGVERGWVGKIVTKQDTIIEGGSFTILDVQTLSSEARVAISVDAVKHAGYAILQPP